MIKSDAYIIWTQQRGVHQIFEYITHNLQAPPSTNIINAKYIATNNFTVDIIFYGSKTVKRTYNNAHSESNNLWLQLMLSHFAKQKPWNFLI